MLYYARRVDAKQWDTRGTRFDEVSLAQALCLRRTSEELKMQFGMIGLGRMGANMARRLLRAGHTCVGYDVHQEAVRALETEGAGGASSLEDLVAQLTQPRV